MKRLLICLGIAALTITGCVVGTGTQPSPAPPQTGSAGTPDNHSPSRPPDQGSTDPQTPQVQTPEVMKACTARTSNKFSVAGIELRTPFDPLRERLGKPTKVETFPRYGDSLYHFPFGSVHVLGDGQITGVNLSEDPPTGDLWPGIRIGARREVVLSFLTDQGYCGIPQPNRNEITFVSSSQLLGLVFSDEGLLQRVSLNEVGE